jgi:hypothetical protein
MRNPRTPFHVPLIVGFICLVAFWTVAEITEKQSGPADEYGQVAYCVACLVGGLWLGRQHPDSFWFGGAVINLPMWITFTIAALIERTPQFQLHFIGLAGGLFLAYAGGLSGRRLSTAKLGSGTSA